MSRLTVTEKEHWKERIERRFNKAIESLEAKDPTLMPRVHAAANLEAHRSLGTADYHARIEEIKQQLARLESEQKDLETAMYHEALGAEATRDANRYRHQSNFQALHGKRRNHFEEELLDDTALGREILKLRAEKEALLDTVWLATSNAQIRDLWSRVTDVLGEHATPLQKQILADNENENT